MMRAISDRSSSEFLTQCSFCHRFWVSESAPGIPSRLGCLAAEQIQVAGGFCSYRALRLWLLTSAVEDARTAWGPRLEANLLASTKFAMSNFALCSRCRAFCYWHPAQVFPGYGVGLKSHWHIELVHKFLLGLGLELREAFLEREGLQVGRPQAASGLASVSAFVRFVALSSP